MEPQPRQCLLSLCVLGTIAQGLSECGTYELDFQASQYKEGAISFYRVTPRSNHI
jgi:hypothetical protein